MRKMTREDLVTTTTIFPTLVIPVGHDGSTSHAVTVVDDLLFDSTQKTAMKLKKESLNWICGTKGFMKFYMVLRFCHREGGDKERLERKEVTNWTD